MSDLWKTPPPAPGEREEEETIEEQEPEPDRYEARHRAEGRPPLIRRKARRLRDQRDPEEPSHERPSIDELLAARPEAEPRWTGEEASAVWPRAPEVEERSRQDTRPELPSRAELRRTRRNPPDEGPRSPDYVGRHLAPKKRTLFARPAGAGADEAEAFLSRDEIAVEPPPEEDVAPPAPEAEPEAIPEATPAASSETHEPESEAVQALVERHVPEVVPEVEEPEAVPEAVEPEAAEPDAIPEAVEREVEEPHEPTAAEPETAPVAGEPVLEAVEEQVLPSPVPPPAAEEEVALQEEEEEAAAAAAVPAGEGAPAMEQPHIGIIEYEPEGEVLGPRRQKLQRRRRRNRIAQIIGSVLLSAALIVGAVIVGNKVIDEVGKEKVAETAGGAPVVREPTTTLIFGTRGEGADKEALWMTLLTYDPEDEQGAVVYVPAHTAVEVPGRGLQGVGESYATGGVPLLLVSAENLLGVKIDSYIELSDSAARELFDATGSLPVNVPGELRVSVGDDEARLILVEGPQELTPSLLVKMLYLRGIDGDDVELGSRHLAFWDALLDRLAQPEDVAALVEDAAVAFEESDASVEDHERLLATLAGLPTGDLTLTTLPVRPVSAGESELYAADEAEIRAFLTDTIGFAAPKSEDIRVQVLNGNGVPGIGQDVARLLVGEGFRVILSGNARRLTYRRTLIITYDNTAEGQRIAERAKRLLGVGEVQVSAQQQGIVDLTIVVGKDFLRAD